MKTLVVALLLLLPSLAFGAAVPFEDVDCNGIYTPGVDVDLSSEIGLPGYPPQNLSLFVEGCIVLPAGSVSPKPWASIAIYSFGGTVTLSTPLTAVLSDPFSYVFIKGELGLTATVGVSAGGDIYIGSESGLMNIGNGTRWTSKSSYVDFVAYDNHLLMGRSVVVRAATAARFLAEGGVVTTEPGLNVLVSDALGQIWFDARDGIDIDTATLKANGVEIATPAQPIAFTNSRVRTVDPASGSTAVISQYFDPTEQVVVKGLVNVTGTQFLDVAPIIIGAPIIGP